MCHNADNNNRQIFYCHGSNFQHFWFCFSEPQENDTVPSITSARAALSTGRFGAHLSGVLKDYTGKVAEMSLIPPHS